MDRWWELCWNWRHRVRMTQEEAARGLGVSLSTYKRWEKGLTTPDQERAGAAMDNMILEYRTVYPAPDGLGDPVALLQREQLAEGA